MPESLQIFKSNLDGDHNTEIYYLILIFVIFINIL